jgi:hypothetical protein
MRKESEIREEIKYLEKEINKISSKEYTIKGNNEMKRLNIRKWALKWVLEDEF